MAKPELGTKRLCSGCGAKFYDLNKDPILCPKCGTAFVVSTPVSRRADTAAAAAASAAAAKSKEAVVEPETQDAEFVSLEDADNEAQGKKGAAEEGDDDLEIEETEEAPFIEEQEEGDDDVTDIIGEGREDEEES